MKEEKSGRRRYSPWKPLGSNRSRKRQRTQTRGDELAVEEVVVRREPQPPLSIVLHVVHKVKAKRTLPALHHV